MRSCGVHVARCQYNGMLLVVLVGDNIISLQSIISCTDGSWDKLVDPKDWGGVITLPFHGHEAVRQRSIISL